MKFDIHYMLTTKYAKWAVASLIAFFSLLIISEYAGLFFTHDFSNATEPYQQRVEPAKQQIYDSALKVPLFGLYVTDDPEDGSVKKSTLDVTLVGVLLGSDATESQVIIRQASGEEKSYKVGDEIPGGAQIKRIIDGGVLVEQEGSLERLSLPKNELTFEPLAKPLQEDK